MSVIRVPIEKLRRDGGTQPRVAINFDVVYEYGELMKQGVVFPPVTAFYDGKTYWLADGFHRVEAAEAQQIDDIDVDVHQGTLGDAQWYSFSANKAHGLRRTNKDKLQAVEAALQHPNSRGLSSRQIADHVGVSHTFVDNEKARLGLATVASDGSRKVACADGRTIDVSNIGSHGSTQTAVNHGACDEIDVRPDCATPQPPQSAAGRDFAIAISHAWAILERESTPAEMKPYLTPEHRAIISDLRAWAEDMEK